METEERSHLTELSSGRNTGRAGVAPLLGSAEALSICTFYSYTALAVCLYSIFKLC